MSTADPYPGKPDAAGALNITDALASAAHPPAAGHTVPVPVAGPAMPSGASNVLWDGSRWTNAYWDGSRWSSAYWDGSRWTGAGFDGSRWSSAYWDGSRWTGAGFDGSRWTTDSWD